MGNTTSSKPPPLSNSFLPEAPTRRRRRGAHGRGPSPRPSPALRPRASRLRAGTRHILPASLPWRVGAPARSAPGTPGGPCSPHPPLGTPVSEQSGTVPTPSPGAVEAQTGLLPGIPRRSGSRLHPPEETSPQMPGRGLPLVTSALNPCSCSHLVPGVGRVAP